MSNKITYRTINGRKMAVVGATKNKDGDYVAGALQISLALIFQTLLMR